MARPWLKRKSRLAALLKSEGDEDEDGLALDRILHGQSVIGKTPKTAEVETLRFQDGDLNVIGTLEYGQFGVIDVVNCCHDGRAYVRKSVEKRFAARNREQCYPQHERDVLLLAAKSGSRWAPHLLCAYQTPTHLNLVMDFAEGGNLWDLIESSPLGGRISEADLRWWAPQLVSAIHWCHTQGFAHRDIKPHNFVLTPDSRVLLIDFGSTAPLLAPKSDGSQLVPKRYCLVPCGTCDYISPEILVAHEEALVALEMECGEDDRRSLTGSTASSEGYGLETDWWSLGAMLYEMALGIAPFFADDVRQTYLRILDHKSSLTFIDPTSVTTEFVDLIRGLLSDSDSRLGRRNVMEITEHPFFDGVDWQDLATEAPPRDLHLPKFTYTEQPQSQPSNGQSFTQSTDNSRSSSYSQPFAFSALFQSSRGSPGVPPLGQASPATPSGLGRVLARSVTRDDVASFIGFSWGPKADAFPPAQVPFASPNSLGAATNTPRILEMRSEFLASPDPRSGNLLSPAAHPFSTPFRPGRPGVDSVANTPFLLKTPYVSTSSESQQRTVPRTGTVRQSAFRRAVSDREAMKQMVDCIGMSAKKKVLESGRKLRVLKGASFYSLGLDRTGEEGHGEERKTLRFVSSPPSFQAWGPADENAVRRGRQLVIDTENGQSHSGLRPGASTSGEETESTETELPPSPSPSPRPGSAMSFRSRRSGTPTATMTLTMTGSYSQRTGGGDGTALLGLPSARRAPDSGPDPGPGPRSRSGSTSRSGADDEDEGGDDGGIFETQQNLPPLPALPQGLTWAKVEASHAALMKDLDSIEKRLRRVSGLIGRWS